jgi:hypothetical protein
MGELHCYPETKKLRTVLFQKDVTGELSLIEHTFPQIAVRAEGPSSRTKRGKDGSTPFGICIRVGIAV